MYKTMTFAQPLLLIACIPGIVACSQKAPQQLVTIADARVNKAQLIDSGKPGDSVGDKLVFNQPLLNAQYKVIGNNSGICTRTRVSHSFQCQWTLSFDNGTIQVAGREFDQGTSVLSIVGGTGKFAGIFGDMTSTNNGDSTFTQTLRFRIH